MTNMLECAEVSSCPHEDIFFFVWVFIFTGKLEVKIIFFLSKAKSKSWWHFLISCFLKEMLSQSDYSLGDMS